MNAADLDLFGGTEPAYRRLFELGRGGMARVYLAESQAFGIRKLVVLKVLNPEFCGDPAVRASFRREAELSAQMNHPNVVQVMAVIEDSGAPVIVMEYLDGTPLSSVLRQASQELPLRLSLYVLSQVLTGLHHLHELKDLEGKLLNAVHRDVSPQNVMILHDGPVKILDFGIAKVNVPDGQATRAGTIKGKLQYMAPEQLLGSSSVDRRADIFPVGVMLWEAAAKRRMWEGKTEVELLRCLATGALPSLGNVAPETPESVVALVKRATDFDRNNRYRSALEMREAIDRVLVQEGWVVQPRELADFMSRHFGESRREQQLNINNKLRELRGFADSSGMYLASRPSARRLSATTVRINPDASRLREVPKRKWVWPAVATGCVALLGAWIMTQHAARSDVPTPHQEPRTVALEVEALPRGAEILLDGRPLAKDRYAGQQLRANQRVVLEVRARGYLSERKEVVFNKDMSLQFVLKPDPANRQQAIAESTPAIGAPPAPSGRAAHARPRATARSNTSRNCDPPYTFGADRVKTYKPECFQ